MKTGDELTPEQIKQSIQLVLNDNIINSYIKIKSDLRKIATPKIVFDGEKVEYIYDDAFKMVDKKIDYLIEHRRKQILKES